jgi:hypothetical protein
MKDPKAEEKKAFEKMQVSLYKMTAAFVSFQQAMEALTHRINLYCDAFKRRN